MLEYISHWGPFFACQGISIVPDQQKVAKGVFQQWRCRRFGWTFVVTRISDRIAPTGLRNTEQPEISSAKRPQLHHLAAQACSCYCRLLAAESDGSRRVVIGCMRPLLRARDRIRDV